MFRDIAVFVLLAERSEPDSAKCRSRRAAVYVWLYQRREHSGEADRDRPCFGKSDVEKGVGSAIWLEFLSDFCEHIRASYMKGYRMKASLVKAQGTSGIPNY